MFMANLMNVNPNREITLEGAAKPLYKKYDKNNMKVLTFKGILAMQRHSQCSIYLKFKIPCI